MSQEVFEIIQEMNMKNINTQLTIQCSPLITGLKAANLLIVESKVSNEAKALFENTALSFIILHEDEESTVFFLYRKEKLQEYIKRSEVSRFLKCIGYNNSNLEEVLEIFAGRYEDYRITGFGFPHEMGILLEYPVEDVEGFMKNNGKNFLYSGYWKVYADVQKKKKIFEGYERARLFVIYLLSKGMTMEDILKKHTV